MIYLCAVRKGSFSFCILRSSFFRIPAMKKFIPILVLLVIFSLAVGASAEVPGSCETRNGETRNGETRNGETRNGETRNGETRNGETEILAALTSRDVFFDPERELSPSLLDFQTVRSTSRDAYRDGELTLPFASAPKTSRVCFDAPITLDASGAGLFFLDLECPRPDAFGQIVFYFASGDGWYSMTAKTEKMSPTEVRCIFSTDSARIEGEPEGLQNVKGVRIAFYAGKPVDQSVRLKALRMRKNDAWILLQDAEKNLEFSQYVKQFGTLLRGMGMTPGMVSESELTEKFLKDVPVLVLPLTAQMEPRTVELLSRYAENGGFLIVCYSAPEELLETLGFRSVGYVRTRDHGLEIAGMAIESDFQKFLEGPVPEFLPQASWNFQVGQIVPDLEDPLLAKPENAPRIAAYWTCANGEKTRYPALLWSARGLWVTHVLLANGGGGEKREFLASLLNPYCPQLLCRMLREKWRTLLQVGIAPQDDVREMYRSAAARALKKLAEDGFAPEQIAAMIFEKTDADAGFRLCGILDEMILEARTEFCTAQKPAANERRFIWEHSGFGIYPGDWDATMKELAEAGFTAILANQAWGGEARYESELLPVSPKVAQYGDSIAEAVKAGKKYGVELHVWKVNFNCMNAPKEFLEKMRAQGRLQVSRDGVEEPWLCPSDPRNQQLEVDSFCEIVRKYDVDGIHFDYIRFPGAGYCFCEGCRERFARFWREKKGTELTDPPQSTWNWEVRELWQEWRRAQIAEVVARTHAAVKKIRPEVEVSAAVFRDYPNCADTVGQDWVQWAKNGWLDFVCPMNYTNSAERFIFMTGSQKEALDAVIPMYPGIGVSSSSSRLTPDQCVIQIRAARELGMPGWTLFALTPGTAKLHIPYLKMGVTAGEENKNAEK